MCMSSDVLYKNVCEMLRNYDKATGNECGGADSVIKNPHAYTGDAAKYLPFYASAARILIDCAEKMDKTRGSRLSAVKRIVKSAAKIQGGRAAGIFKTGDEFTICDGHRLLFFNDDIESVNHLEEAPFNCKPMRESVDNATGEEVALPAVGDVRAAMAAERAKKSGAPFFVIPGRLAVDPAYLLDMMQIIPDAKVVWDGKKTSPLYFRGADACGMLCPVNFKDPETAAA